MQSCHVAIHPEVRSILNPDGAVLLHLGRGRYQSLNGSGAVIWSEIGAGTTCDELVARVAKRYPAVLRERLESDVTRFLGQLEARGLLSLETQR